MPLRNNRVQTRNYSLSTSTQSKRSTTSSRLRSAPRQITVFRAPSCYLTSSNASGQHPATSLHHTASKTHIVTSQTLHSVDRQQITILITSALHCHPSSINNTPHTIQPTITPASISQMHIKRTTKNTLVHHLHTPLTKDIHSLHHFPAHSHSFNEV